MPKTPSAGERFILLWDAEQFFYDLVIGAFALGAQHLLSVENLMEARSRPLLLAAAGVIVAFLPRYLIQLMQRQGQPGGLLALLQQPSTQGSRRQLLRALVLVVLLGLFLMGLFVPFWLVFFISKLEIIPPAYQGVAGIATIFGGLISLASGFISPLVPFLVGGFLLGFVLSALAAELWSGAALGALLFGLWLWNIKSTNALPRRWCKLLRSSPALRRGLKRAKSVLLPLCLASALVLWQQMQVAATLAYQARFHDLPLLTSLILSGLLPLRLLLALRPPYKPANLIMGVLVFALYLKMLWPLLGQA
ncbi:MAG: hypothetical protein J7M05_05920 [Anaerolineae bacterium]|nr:hypothetical protein [Anaerolineae bacterium]